MDFNTMAGPFWILQLWAYAYIPEFINTVDFKVDTPLFGHLYIRAKPKLPSFEGALKALLNYMVPGREPALFAPMMLYRRGPVWLTCKPGTADDENRESHKSVWGSFLIARDLLYDPTPWSNSNKKTGLSSLNLLVSSV
ncbi:hypothetical protein DVA67_035950 [Solirubrobacter sp. CPCC 204708]|nr:hypothetical protein [Solirubrobacter deserti]